MQPAARRDEKSSAPERRPRVRRNVTAAIAEDICANRYAVGTLLPRENDLCELYGVSRTVIRESLKVLESRDLCAASRASAPPSATRTTGISSIRMCWNGWDRISRDFDLLASILEARRTIEPAAAEYAASRATAQEIANLDDAWQRMQSANDDPEAFTEADLLFHTVLLKASHNQVFHRLSSAIHAALKFALHASNLAMPDHREALALHGKVVEALRLRDAAGARDCVNRILDLAKRDLTAAGRTR